MPEPTDQITTGAGPALWCHWHRGPSSTARLIAFVEQGSGPGATLYACAPCREQRGLVPFGEQS